MIFFVLEVLHEAKIVRKKDNFICVLLETLAYIQYMFNCNYF